MKTISPALQSLAPISCSITQPDGRPITLSVAGFVLRPGKSYHLRILLPVGDAAVGEVAFAAAPAYIKPDPAGKEPEQGGRAVRVIPFHVKLSGGLLRVANSVQIHSDDLEVKYSLGQDGALREGRHLCPITVIPFVGPILLSTVVSLVFTLAQTLLGRLLDPGKPLVGGLIGFLVDLLSKPESLILFVALLAGLSGVILAIHWWQRIARARELWFRFRDCYNWGTTEALDPIGGEVGLPRPRR